MIPRVHPLSQHLKHKVRYIKPKEQTWGVIMLSIIEKRRVEPTLLYHAGSRSSKAPAKNGKLGTAL